MKRAALILAVLMLFSLAACGREGKDALSPTAAPTEAVT
jgi:predicted small lipoprotein YifL